MSSSLLTKNALARSLKKLMLTRPLNKITIQQAHSGLRGDPPYVL